MSNKKTVELVIMIVIIAGVLLAVAAGIFAVMNKAGDSFLAVTAGLTVLALLAALIYFLKGAKKNAAGYFKLFMAFYGLAEFSSIISSSGLALDQPAAVAINAAIFALLILLVAGTDMGKAKSILICAGILILALASLVGAVILFPGISRGGTPLGTLYTLRAAANLILCVLTFVMVLAKYADKTRRGTT